MYCKFLILSVSILFIQVTAHADELERRLNGTWVLSAVEVRNASGEWVVRESVALGMLIYHIEGPMSGSDTASGATPTTAAQPSPSGLSEERVVMTLAEEDVRLLWRKGIRN